MQGPIHGFVTVREVARLSEEVVRGPRGFRCNRLTAPEFHRVGAMAFPGGGAGGREARVHQEHARQNEVIDVPPIDVAWVALHLRHERRRRDIELPPRDAQAAGNVLDLGTELCIRFRAAQGALVHVREVREI